MRVNVLNTRQQEFNGTVYYACGQYFQNKGQRLHRIVWEYHNGEIPKGMHIHHIDGDRANNQPENLKLVTAKDHAVTHCQEEERQAYLHRHIADMQEQAKAWHASEEGRAWHAARGKANWENKEKISYVCTCCGKAFESRHRYAEGKNRFCCGACRARHFHARRSNHANHSH